MATSTVTFLNPVFGALWGALFLAETISPTFLAGALLVFVSLVLIFDVPLPAAVRGPGGGAAGRGRSARGRRGRAGLDRDGPGVRPGRPARGGVPKRHFPGPGAPRNDRG